MAETTRPSQRFSARHAAAAVVAIAVFNGTAQLVMTWLVRATGDVLWPAYYMAAFTAVGIAAMAMMRETAPIKIEGRAP